MSGLVMRRPHQPLCYVWRKIIYSLYSQDERGVSRRPETRRMLLCIEHETKLIYSEPVAEHVVEVRMAPLSDDDQTTLGYRLRIVPGAPVTAYRDGFGNRVDLFNFYAPCQEVTVQATSYVRTQRR